MPTEGDISVANGRGKSDSRVTVTLNLDRRLREGVDSTFYGITDFVNCAVLEFLKLSADTQTSKMRKYKEFEADLEATVRGYRVAKDQ